MATLLVEDEEVVRNVITEMLESAGHEVFQAISGDAGIGLLRVNDKALFDLVITDHDTPGEANGYEVIRCAREINFTIPVVLMSGRIGDADLTAACDAADAILEKPNVMKIHEVVAEARRKRQLIIEAPRLLELPTTAT